MRRRMAVTDMCRRRVPDRKTEIQNEDNLESEKRIRKEAEDYEALYQGNQREHRRNESAR